jgi:hypothetical protein
MMSATKRPVVMTLGDFTVECLGVDYPDYFQGYGLGPKSNYSDCCYGIGNTEAEALEDCMEMMAQSGRVDLDEAAEKRIREDYGHCDDTVTAAEEAGCEDESDDADNMVYEGPYWHVGIKWNVREEQRLARIRKIPNLQPLTYSDYCIVPKDEDGYSSWKSQWGYIRRAEGSVGYGDFKNTDWPDSAESYLGALSDKPEDSEEIYFYVPYASGSDYSGSTVEKSNAKVFEETYGSEEWVHSVYGGYSTYAVAVGLTGLLTCADDTFDAICEALEGLADYPLLDEEAHSALEMELSDEAWDSWGKDSFVKELEAEFAEDAEFNWPDDSTLRKFFEDKREEANEYWFNEGYGPDMYVRIDEVVKGITFDDLEKWAVCYEVSWVAVGAESEVFYRESDAKGAVDTLRASGIIGASYRLVETVKTETK